MAFSTYSANKVLDCLLRGVAITTPTRVYASLHTADPGHTGDNEVSLVDWPGYARRDPAQGGAIATGFSAASAKATANALQMLFAEHNGAAPVTITHVAIWDAATGGNCLFAGPLAVARTISPTDEVVIRAGELDLAVT